MREVLSFFHKERRSCTTRGTIVELDRSIHQALVLVERDGDCPLTVSASVDARDCIDPLLAIVSARSAIVRIDCDVSNGRITKMILLVQEDAVDAALDLGSWDVEDAVVNLCRAMWRTARAPRSTHGAEWTAPRPGESTDPRGAWNEDRPPFAHQLTTVQWMLDMESQFPLDIRYEGNIRVTGRWYVDTEQQCFTEDASWREAQLAGGICADGMGQGKTCSALRLVTTTLSPGVQRAAVCRDQCASEASLLILPINLVSQWRQEMEKFLRLDRLKIVWVVQGRDVRSNTMNDLCDADIVITTFDFLRNNRTYQDHVEAALAGRPKERASLAAWARARPRRGECVLEAVVWRRIVVDEIHQMFERPSHMRSFLLFRCRAAWGLSATPAIDDERAQHLYTLMTREKAHHPNLLASLVAKAVSVTRRTEAFGPDQVSPRDLRLVNLSAEERVRLSSHARDLSLGLKVRNMTFLSCDAGSADRGDIASQVALTKEREMAILKTKIDAQERNVRIMESTERTLREELERTRTDSTDKDALVRMEEAHQQMLQDVVAARRMRDDHVGRMVTRVEQERAVFKRISELRSAETCDACRDNVASRLAMPCMHVLCRECLPRPGEVACPTCGSCVDDVLPVAVCSGVGTKMREVAELVASIGPDDPIVLFAQWKSMMRGIRTFLGSCGLGPLVLEGNATHRAATLRALMDGGVLVLCLEDGFAGLHLPHVSHVIFAHAIVGNVDHVRTLEEQAIARCRRPGQTRKVSTYSFVVADTEESELYFQTHDQTPSPDPQPPLPRTLHPQS